MTTQWKPRVSATGRLDPVPGGRPNPVYVRYSNDEIVQVAARAQHYGLPVTAFVHYSGLWFEPAQGTPMRARPVALRRAVDQTLLAELGPIRRVLAGVGTNLNQMATVANSTGQLPAAAHFTEVHRSLYDALNRLNDLLDTTGHTPDGRFSGSL